jgi:hypothetical protein
LLREQAELLLLAMVGPIYPLENLAGGKRIHRQPPLAGADFPRNDGNEMRTKVLSINGRAILFSWNVGTLKKLAKSVAFRSSSSACVAAKVGAMVGKL